MARASPSSLPQRPAPSGLVKITTFHWIAVRLLAERLPAFLTSHPDITVEVTAEDGLTDIVSAGFDAGIRLREAVENDMIGVRVGSPLRTLVTATPAYWRTHGYPTHPSALRRHRCINYRQSSGGALLP